MSVEPHVAMLVGLTMLTGCALIDRTAGLPLCEPSEPPPAEYRLRPGDVLRMHLPHHPALDEVVIIRPDGRVVLPVAGELRADQHTAATLSREVAERLRVVALEPAVFIDVTEARGALVSIGGEVAKPQRVAHDRAGTVAEAFAVSGGVLFSGDLDRIVLIRNSLGGNPSAFRVPFEPTNADVGAMALHPGDVLFVPKTYLARFVLAVEQYLWALVPIRSRFYSWFELNQPRPETAAVTRR